MKAFLVGALTLVAVVALAGLGFLLMPCLLLLTAVLRVIFVAVLIILAIWIFGKFVLYLWSKLR